MTTRFEKLAELSLDQQERFKELTRITLEIYENTTEPKDLNFMAFEFICRLDDFHLACCGMNDDKSFESFVEYSGAIDSTIKTFEAFRDDQAKDFMDK